MLGDAFVECCAGDGTDFDVGADANSGFTQADEGQVIGKRSEGDRSPADPAPLLSGEGAEDLPAPEQRRPDQDLAIGGVGFGETLEKGGAVLGHCAPQ